MTNHRLYVDHLGKNSHNRLPAYISKVKTSLAAEITAEQDSEKIVVIFSSVKDIS